MSRTIIGIPTLNRPHMVRETIASVLAQEDTDWTALVSDNCSEEATRADVAAHVAGVGDARIGFHQQRENVGEYGQGRLFYETARDRGARYLVILHDDDRLRPEYLRAGIDALEAQPDLAFFVCNPTIIDADGRPNDEFTRRFDALWGRNGVPEGPIEVLSTHMRSGFTPISSTLFRVAALKESGFVDEDLGGCFPFESNVFLRLGERGAQAWFTPARHFELRWHVQQMTHWGFLDNPEVVASTITLYERRRFAGEAERRRRALLGKLYRIEALRLVKAGNISAARAAVWASVRYNPRSLRNWVAAPAAILPPQVLRWWGRAERP